MENNQIKQMFKNRILWKIYLIWFFRRIVPLMIAQAAIIVLALKIFAKNVFVAKVLENAALASNSSYWELLKYLTIAFFKTHPIVQVSILIVLGISALFLRDIGRSVFTYLETIKKRNETKDL